MHMTSREFNQDTARAKREAKNGPVFVTDRGKPTHVLLSVEEFERMKGPRKSIAELFYTPGADEVELPLPERTIEPVREIDWGLDR